MIKSEQITQDIEKILKEKIGVQLEQPLDGETSLLKDGVALDSVMLLELIIEIELMYDIEIDEDELSIDYFQKLSKLVEFIIGKVDAK